MKPVTTSIFQILLLIVCISVPMNVSAQKVTADPYLLVNTLNDNSGLPQNSIITQYVDTSSGMLWLATFGGLVRYNGIALQSFNQQHSDSLLTNKMVNLFKTGNGDIYAMNVHSQLLKIGKQGISINQSLTWIWQQYALYVWFRGILNNTEQIQKLGIHAFGRPAYYPEQESWTAGEYNYYITALTNNSFAVTTKKNELLIYNDQKIQFRYPLPIKAENAKIFLSNGLLYILNDQLEGVCFKNTASQPELFPQALEGLTALKARIASKNSLLYYNELNDQAIIGFGKELVVLGSSKQGLTAGNELHIDQLPRSISNILFYPQHNTLFIGTTTEGLFVFRKNNFRQLMSPGLEVNVNSNYAQVITGGNQLTTNRGVTYDLETSQSSYRKLPVSMYSPFTRDAAGGYYMCNENFVWYVVPGGEAKVFYENSLKNKTDNIIRFIWLDQQTNRLWIMETFQWGYWENGNYHVVVHSKEKLPQACYFARNQSHLFLATDRGLVMLNEKKKKWWFVSGTENMELRFVRFDQEAPVCWFGTYGRGFGAYLPDKDTVLFFPQDPNNYLANTHALIEDERKNIWIPTNKGLFRVQKSQLLHFVERLSSEGEILYYDYFDRQDGLTTNEFNGGAQPIYNQWKDEILLSTINGILRFAPSGILHAGWKEPLFIDYAQTRSGKLIPAPENGQDWIFDKNERSVSWVINKACWTNPYSMRIEYRIDDQPQWKVIDGRSLATGWEKVGGGNHTLYLRQYAGAGNRYNEMAIPFSVSLYWYETWWFLALAILFIVGLLLTALLHFSFLKKLLKVNRKKDEVLSETLSLMEEGNAMLDASNLYKTKMVHVLMHDITVPVASIEKVSGMISRNIDKVSPDVVKTVMKEINEASRNLLILSDQLIQWSNIQETYGADVVVPSDIHAIVEEVREELSDRFVWRNNVLNNLVPEDLQIYTKNNLLHHLIFNLVLNANKYMNDGEIEVEASQVEGYTMLVVKDNGTGMDESVRQQLISASESNDSSVVYSGYKLWSIGYQIIFDLVRLMNGEIEVKSGKNDTGLIIAIGLPPSRVTQSS